MCSGIDGASSANLCRIKYYLDHDRYLGASSEPRFSPKTIAVTELAQQNRLFFCCKSNIRPGPLSLR